MRSLPKLSRTGVFDFTVDLVSDFIVKGFSSIEPSSSFESSGNVSEDGKLENVSSD